MRDVNERVQQARELLEPDAAGRLAEVAATAASKAKDRDAAVAELALRENDLRAAITGHAIMAALIHGMDRDVYGVEQDLGWVAIAHHDEGPKRVTELRENNLVIPSGYTYGERTLHDTLGLQRLRVKQGSNAPDVLGNQGLCVVDAHRAEPEIDLRAVDALRREGDGLGSIHGIKEGGKVHRWWEEFARRAVFVADHTLLGMFGMDIIPVVYKDVSESS